MDTLQKMFEEALRNLPYEELATLAAQKLKEQGITLTPNQVRSLAKRFAERLGDGTFTFGGGRRSRRSATIEFTEQESDELVARVEEMYRRAGDHLDDIADSLVPAVTRLMKRRWRAERVRAERGLAGFRTRLRKRWQAPLRLLKLLIDFSREVGSAIDDALRAEPPDSQRAALIEALTRLHARSCGVGEEVLVLLEAGFATGAMARWRTLHEIAVTAAFITEHGGPLAERYLLHDIVESRRANDLYDECAPKLGWDPMPREERAAADTQYEIVCRQFANTHFEQQYGWAAPYVENPKRVTFASIQAAAGFKHLKAHYKMASHGVHANATGVLFQLGLLEESEMLLSGPSNAGLEDPGSSTAISLVQVFGTVIGLRPTLDTIIAGKIALNLEQEIREAFARSAERLRADDRRVRGSDCVPR